MYFLPDQVAEYDRKKMTSGAPRQSSVFVSDEASTVQWLRQPHQGKATDLLRHQPTVHAATRRLEQERGPSSTCANCKPRTSYATTAKARCPSRSTPIFPPTGKSCTNLPKDDPTLVAKATNRWYLPDPNKAGDLEKLREGAAQGV